jgi:hypothetical protein
MKPCVHTKESKERKYISFVAKQNKAQRLPFSKTVFAERLIFVPHCMRNTAVCTAKEKDFYYICQNCGGCTIFKIKRLAEELGYGGFYILKGGRAVVKLVQDVKPKAVVGIACFFEGEQGFKILKGTDIAVQYVPLTKDGCHDTDADILEAERILRQKD